MNLEQVYQICGGFTRSKGRKLCPKNNERGRLSSMRLYRRDESKKRDHAIFNWWHVLERMALTNLLSDC